MARVRLSARAEADLREILRTSGERWGDEARLRYSKLIAAALRKVASDPNTAESRGREELSPGMRSLHLRHARAASATRVKRPVHVLFYRATPPGLLEIVRVLHERMEPAWHLEGGDEIG